MTSNPRSRKDLHDFFIQQTNAEIKMGQYSQSEPIVVVEGILDTKLIDKLRNNKLTVIPIEKLIKATIKGYEERRKTKSARDLVKIVCDLFIKNNFKFVFGIRDADTYALKEFIRHRKWNFSPKPNYIFDTRPCRDMETVLYSALFQCNRFLQGFPKKFDECVQRSEELAYVGLGLHEFNRKDFIKGWNGGLKGFSDSYRYNRQSYYDLCECSEKIADAFIEFHKNRFSEESSYELKKIVADKKLIIKQTKIKWFELSRGHDLERMLQYTNPNWDGRKLNELLIRLIDYECLKNFQMFKSIQTWRTQNKVPALFRR